MDDWRQTTAPGAGSPAAVDLVHSLPLVSKAEPETGQDRTGAGPLTSFLAEVLESETLCPKGASILDLGCGSRVLSVIAIPSGRNR